MNANLPWQQTPGKIPDGGNLGSDLLFTTSTSATMVTKTIQWPQRSQRELLEWVEAHKGPDSELIFEKGAIKTLTESLNGPKNGRGKYDFGAKALTQTAVRQKLEELWSFRSWPWRWSKIEAFYEDGLRTFDWDRFSDEIVGEYTAAEIESLKQKYSNGEESQQSVRDDTQKNGKRSSGDLAAEDSESRPGDGEALQRSPKRPRSQAPNDNAPARQQSGGGYVDSDRARREYTPQYAQRILSSDGLNNPLPIDASDIAQGGEIRFQDGHRRMFTDAPDMLPAGNAQDAMETLGMSIVSTVGNYLFAIDLPDGQHTVLDDGARYPSGCVVLLDRVIGQLGWPGTNRRTSRLSTFHKARVLLSDFLKSFIGCAVTYWCFKSDVDEEWHYSTLDDGNVQRAFQKAFDAQMQAEMRQRLWREYLDKSVRPKINGEAYRMAHLLETYIELFLPEKGPPRRFYVDQEVVELPSREAREEAEHEDTATNGERRKNAGPATSPRFIFKEPTATLEFRKMLISIFQHALKWKAETSMCIDERLSFSWASFLWPYKSSDYKEANVSTLVEGDGNKGHSERLVLLCLMPVVSRSERTYVARDEWTSSKVIAKGQVLRF